jgi:hypothetical protein
VFVYPKSSRKSAARPEKILVVLAVESMYLSPMEESNPIQCQLFRTKEAAPKRWGAITIYINALIER